ncbi:MAG: aminotransferase class V-fold PLP-dependent enzyme [Parashewanella sp.]
MPHSTPLCQIYLDANATTQVHPEAAKAALSTMQDVFGNPSSSHISGLKAKNLMTKARNAAKKHLGNGDGKLIFTSGATEGIQTAIISALVAAKSKMKPNKKYCLLYGATEHKAVPESLKHWNELLGINADIKAIPVCNNGELDTGFIAREVQHALIICTMAVNNETGVYQDLAKLEDAIRANNPTVFWMVDCVQALGKRALQLEQTSIDYAPFSGHKLYAPKGIGLLYVREHAPFTPFIAGGGQENGLRSGTENLPGMAAFKVIFDMLNGESRYRFANNETLNQYRSQILGALTHAFPNLVLNHSLENTVATTINFSVPNFSSKEIMDLFDAANIRVSSGSACSSKVTRSFVLDAMGLSTWQSESAIRMSFGPMMTQDECDQACQRITQAAAALKHSCLIQSDEIEAAPLNGLMELKSGNSCCWLLTDGPSNQAVIIDPLPELIERIESIVNCQQLTIKAILDTHGHADHQSSRSTLINKLNLAETQCHLGWPNQSEQTLIQGERYPSISIGTQTLVKVATPGHTADSVSYLLFPTISTATSHCQYAFCGDTILMGSLGRTNFDCSSAEEMYFSLNKLASLLSADTLICASHDYFNEFATTLTHECSRTPLLKQVMDNSISVTDFIAEKSLLDAHLMDQAGCEIQCGAYVAVDNSLSIKEYDKLGFESLMKTNSDAKLIDIREPHEYALNRSNKAEINVPLTRLVQFLSENIHNKQQQYILVCRSGTRSLLVAQAMGRLGFENIGHLQGGYAMN